MVRLATHDMENGQLLLLQILVFKLFCSLMNFQRIHQHQNLGTIKISLLDVLKQSV